MKLRNLLLTSALLLTAGAAFAGVVDYPDYSWTNDTGSKIIDVTLEKFQTQEDYQYAAYDTSYNPADLTAKYNEIKEAVMADSTIAADDKLTTIVSRLQANGYENVWLLKDPGKNNALTTTIATQEAVAQFGVINLDHTVYSVPNETTSKFYFRELSVESTMYGKLKEHGGGNDNSAKISFAPGTFGAPLPAPVVTLLIALGLGAGLVMYRNRKQAKA